uniref:Uncharacterized protein n=1 Tax=Opuntia streptacantha TaxID=393608 RepID=A0A7C8ZU42_OPUST
MTHGRRRGTMFMAASIPSFTALTTDASAAQSIQSTPARVYTRERFLMSTTSSKLAPQMSLTQLPLWRDCRGGVAIEGIPVDCTRFLTLPHLLLLLILCTGFALA